MIDSLQQLLAGRYAELRRQYREVLCRPDFALVDGLSTAPPDALTPR
jgi:hypothetical protein